MSPFRLLTLSGLLLASGAAAQQEFNISVTGGNTGSYVWAKTEGTSTEPHITIKSKKASLNPVVFLSKEYTESRFEMIARIQVMQSGSANSEVGLMVRTSKAEQGDWAKATLTKDNRVLFQQKIGGQVETSVLEYQVIAGKAVYFKAFIDVDRVDFFIANTPAIEATRWHKVGPSVHFPYHLHAGFCLIPRSGTTEDIGRISEITFRGTGSSGALAKRAGWLTDGIKWLKGAGKSAANGLVSLAMDATSIVSGTSDIIIQIMVDIDFQDIFPTAAEVYYNSDSFGPIFGEYRSILDRYNPMAASFSNLNPNLSPGTNDAGLQRHFAAVLAHRNGVLVPVTGIVGEVDKIIQARQNAEIYLADMVVNKITNLARKYPNPDPDMLYFEFAPAMVLAKMDKAIDFCSDATTITLYNPLDWLSIPMDIYDCIEAEEDAQAAYDAYASTTTGSQKDLIILEATNLAFTLNLMNAADAGFHWGWYSKRKRFTRGLLDWVSRVEGFYFGNNIPIKA